MHLGHLCVCAIFFAPTAVGAQVAASRPEEAGRAALPADSIPRSIIEAERIGARRPSPSATNPVDSASDRLARGTPERKCVDVSGLSVARSGDFVAGPFDRYSSLWHTGFGKIWWQPRNIGGPGVMPLVVRATRLDANGADRVFEMTSIARGGNPRTGEMSPTRFYPSGIRLPSTGTWLLLATAGENWGCFVFTFE